MQDDNRMNRDGLISLAGGVPVYGGGYVGPLYAVYVSVYSLYIYMCSPITACTRWQGRAEARQREDSTG